MKTKETVTQLVVRVVSGISLAVRPGEDGLWTLHTVMAERLSSKYQVIRRLIGGIENKWEWKPKGETYLGRFKLKLGIFWGNGGGRSDPRR